MKRVFKILGLLVLVLAGALVVLTLFLGSIVRNGVETVGPQLTQTDLKLDRVFISLLSGQGELRGFTLGNPRGYDSPSAMAVGRASLDLDPRSLFSDKIIIRSVHVVDPEITFEGGLKRNNLRQILKNVRAVTARPNLPPSPPREQSPAPRKDDPPGQTRIQVDEFILQGAKVRYAVPGLAGQTIGILLPDVALRNLGRNKEGITVAELTQLIFEALIQRTTEAVSQAGAERIGGATKDLGRDVLPEVGKAGQDLLDRSLQAP